MQQAVAASPAPPDKPPALLLFPLLQTHLRQLPLFSPAQNSAGRNRKNSRQKNASAKMIWRKPRKRSAVSKTGTHRSTTRWHSKKSTLTQLNARNLQKNMQKEQKEHKDVPPQYQDFSEVFDKKEFDALPPSWPWDHAIELKPGSEPSSCKVYPLLQPEQEELNKFLGENLEYGCIRPSKSPMASPFFFIKKKDGSLRPVQDYRMNDN